MHTAYPVLVGEPLQRVSPLILQRRGWYHLPKRTNNNTRWADNHRPLGTDNAPQPASCYSQPIDEECGLRGTSVLVSFNQWRLLRKGCGSAITSLNRTGHCLLRVLRRDRLLCQARIFSSRRVVACEPVSLRRPGLAQRCAGNASRNATTNSRLHSRQPVTDTVTLQFQ